MRACINPLNSGAVPRELRSRSPERKLRFPPRLTGFFYRNSLSGWGCSPPRDAGSFTIRALLASHAEPAVALRYGSVFFTRVRGCSPAEMRRFLTIPQRISHTEPAGACCCESGRGGSARHFSSCAARTAAVSPDVSKLSRRPQKIVDNARTARLLVFVRPQTAIAYGFGLNERNERRIPHGGSLSQCAASHNMIHVQSIHARTINITVLVEGGGQALRSPLSALSSGTRHRRSLPCRL